MRAVLGSAVLPEGQRLVPPSISIVLDLPSFRGGNYLYVSGEDFVVYQQAEMCRHAVRADLTSLTNLSASCALACSRKHALTILVCFFCFWSPTW